MQKPVPLPSELNRQLQAHFERTREAFDALGAKAPEAIVLGGGYGRGEGGIAKDAEQQFRFFNDLDYFIFTDSPEDPQMIEVLHQWEQSESALLKIDVEGKCLPKSDLEQTPGSMMFYDLVAAQTIVSGPDDFFSSYKSLAKPETIETIEATRLLWNRGTGLLFARHGLASGGELSLVHRNQAKAKLALGDALLTIRGKYRAYVRERQSVLQQLDGVDVRIAELHAEGVAFKLRPTHHPSRQVLESVQEELTALWLKCFLEVESARLGKRFGASSDYAGYFGKIFPDTSFFRNLLLGMRDRLKRGGGVRPIFDYPRGALQRSLVLLLEERIDFKNVSRLLGQRLEGLDETVEVYTKWWEHYS